MPILKNPKHEAFAQALAKGETADTAYISAGYKRDRSNAAKLTTNHHVQARVTELVEASADRTGVTIDRTLNELGCIAFSDPRKLFTSRGAILDPEDWGDDTAASLASVEVVSKPTGEKDEYDRPIVEHVHKVRMWDKNSALEKLCKHLGMFTEKIDINANAEPLVPQRPPQDDLEIFAKFAQMAKRRHDKQD